MQNNFDNTMGPFMLLKDLLLAQEDRHSDARLSLDRACAPDAPAALVGINAVAAELIDVLRRKLPITSWSLHELAELTDDLPPGVRVEERDRYSVLAYANSHARHLALPVEDFDLSSVQAAREGCWILGALALRAADMLRDEHPNQCEALIQLALGRAAARIGSAAF